MDDFFIVERSSDVVDTINGLNVRKEGVSETSAF